MKQIPVNGTSVTLALALLVVAIGATWGVVGLTTQNEIRVLKEQIKACERSSAAKSAGRLRSTRSAAEAVALEVQKSSYIRGLKNENEKLRKANEEKNA